MSGDLLMYSEQEFSLENNTVVFNPVMTKNLYLFEPFTAISLSFPVGYFSLEDLLHNYCGETSIQYECPQCRYTVTASHSLCIWKLPSVLVLHLNRFEDSDGLRRDQSYIRFPLKGLDIGRFGENPTPKMNLYAVSNHYGTMHGGHYSKLWDHWYNFDDHKITQISTSTVLVCSVHTLLWNLVVPTTVLYRA